MKKIICLLFVWCFMLTNLSAAPAYKWEFMALKSTQYPSWENVVGKTVATKNHGGDIIEVLVDVLGTGDKTSVDIEYVNMSLYQKFDLVNSSNVIVGTRYHYIKYGNTHSSALLRAKDYSTVKAILGFN